MNRPRLPRVSFRMGTVGFGLASAAIFGIALFIGIADIGFGRILSELEEVGFGLLGIIVVHIAQLIFCALAWNELLSDVPHPERPKLPELLGLRWIRESIDSLLPVAQIGGEVA